VNGGHVTIGVPVYRGERFLAEAVDSLLAQTHTDYDVVFSLDGPDPACEAICARYLDDPRFRLVVQPERRGWVGNIDWLMGQVTGDYWYYHQQDDTVHPTYLATLLAAARTEPGAAAVYCDIEAFGDVDAEYRQPSVTGADFERQLTMLNSHLAAVAFRGLTRADALRATGGLRGNDHHDFCAEAVWLAALAHQGELVRVPGRLYRKRYHADNIHTRWNDWTLADRQQAWIVHCHDMLEQAMGAEATTVQDRRLLWIAGVQRLVWPRPTAAYIRQPELDDDARVGMVRALVDRLDRLGRVDVPTLVEDDWPPLLDWTGTVVQLPGLAAQP
jgi:glycosyltransferase involved in cell wall biosynthesis